MCINTRKLPALEGITLTRQLWELVLMYGSMYFTRECDIALSQYRT